MTFSESAVGWMEHLGMTDAMHGNGVSPCRVWPWLRGSLSLVMVLFLLFSPPTLAVDSMLLAEGDTLFEAHCSGCHPHGGNIIRRGKTLKQRALRRNGVDSVAAIADLVTHGKNNMSAFEDRLSEAQIDAVAAYVLAQAKTGWR